VLDGNVIGALIGLAGAIIVAIIGVFGGKHRSIEPLQTNQQQSVSDDLFDHLRSDYDRVIRERDKAERERDACRNDREESFKREQDLNEALGKVTALLGKNEIYTSNLEEKLNMPHRRATDNIEDEI
jgi:hypothetical protein